MRQVTIRGPKGSARKIAEIAFAVGISDATIGEKRVLHAAGQETIEDSFEVEVGTPAAKAFLDALTNQTFFTRDKFSVAVRQPRALVSREKLIALTRPLVEPSIDLFEELWQFSQVTYGFIGRIFIGALLLSLGLIEYQLLLIIAGLLFIPLLPLLLSIGFGFRSKQWRLVLQGFASLTIAIVLMISAGVVVGLVTNPPMRYSEFSSLLTGLFISTAVGAAGGLATVDDVGRREMIGLAATAQIAIIPAWFGSCLVLGFPASEIPPSKRLLALMINVIAIVISSTLTYALVGIRGSALKIFHEDSPVADRLSQ
jgi:Predicted membrane protein